MPAIQDSSLASSVIKGKHVVNRTQLQAVGVVKMRMQPFEKNS